jgi:riboflavin kinase / FMN adenylyltransferase
VQLGHQALLKQVVESARSMHLSSLVLTFEPHPFEFFLGDQLHIPRITRLREKWCYLAACGIDHVVVLKFNQALANVSASDFIEQMLFAALHPRQIIIGDDFHFGNQRQGDFAFLKQKGLSLGFEVKALPTVTNAAKRISSTRVREALLSGNQQLARELLGRPYCMQGRVRHGQQRGRQLGFPTANIYLHRQLSPLSGVYTVYLHGLPGYDKGLPGVANIGTRPTVDGTRTLLEVHLLDFCKDIYGAYVSVEFCEKLRDEMRYAHLSLLQKQIAKDVEAARAYFNQFK